MNPVIEMLVAGTEVFRVHSARFGPAEFKPFQPGDHTWSGGRFDSSDYDQYSFMYTGDTQECAFSEMFFRDRVVGPTCRMVLPAEVEHRQISTLVLENDVPIVKLHGAGLVRITQDAWLTSCDGDEYVKTRSWASRLRAAAPTAAGFVWRSRLNNDLRSYVFFEDRAVTFVKTGRTWSLDRRVGRSRLACFLDDYGVPHRLNDMEFT